MKREPKRPLVPRVEKAKSSQSFDRLRVVPLSLSPSCVTQMVLDRLRVVVDVLEVVVGGC